MQAANILSQWTNRDATGEILRYVRNTITGRELRKIEFIQAGIIPRIQEYLASLISEPSEADSAQKPLCDAASILSMLASSGSAFTTPILSSNIIPLLLTHFCATTTKASRSTLAILQCLDQIAEHLPLQAETSWMADQRLANLLYTDEIVPHLVASVHVASGSGSTQTQNCALAALTLVYKTCSLPQHRHILKQHGILHALATSLKSASRCINWKQSPPRGLSSGTTATRARCSALLAVTLQVICMLIETFITDAQDFVALDSIRAFFEGHNIKPASPTEGGSGLVFADASPHFPALDSSIYASASVRRRSSNARRETFAKPPSEHRQSSQQLDITWLCHFVRAERGLVRVMAIRLLAILKNHGLVQSAKLREASALLVPCLVQMLPSDKSEALTPTQATVYDLVPATLALTIRDDEILQDVAVAANAIARLTAALKLNLDVKQSLEARAWWPHRNGREPKRGTDMCSLGDSGPSTHVRRNMLQREGILQALASIAPARDAYRKDICDQGAIAQIILALEPFGSSRHPSVYGDSMLFHGNSPETLIAACGAVRVLTRSATALRTKLIDADIAKSILNLLKHADPRVRVAATMVVANLAHDFSPMKTSVCEEHVIQKLCEQAHSAHAHLRLESLFALKALVNNSNNALKRQVVERLNPSWIKLLIGTDPQDIPPGEIIGLVPSEYEIAFATQPYEPTSDLLAMDGIQSSATTPSFSNRTVQDDIEIQAELLAFLRNLITGEQPAEVIDYLFEHIGKDDFLQILLERLSTPETIVPRYTSQIALSNFSVKIITHTLYILSHLCAAGPQYRNAICYNTHLMKRVIHLLKSQAPGIQSAACWLINNIVHPMNNREIRDDIARAREMQKLGAFVEIKRLESSTSADVIERAKTVSEVCRQLFSIG